MEDILDQETTKNTENSKFEKIAFFSFLAGLIYLFLKFVNYSFTAFALIDSVLIPKYTVSFALKESFFTGLILSFGLLITFYLYKLKKYQLVIMLNAIFIVQSLALPYILNFVNN